MELVTDGELATAINIHTHDMIDVTQLLDKDVVRDDGGLGETWLCALSSNGKLVIQESFDDLQSHHEPGSK